MRSTNQDSYLVNKEKNLYIIADGMGGHAGGEIASQICISEINSYHNSFLEDNKSKNNIYSQILANLANAINHASAIIYEKALENPKLKGMGTTTTVCKIYENKALIAHVGDSRCYLIRAGFIYQITSDHSLVNEQLKAGLITEEEAKTHHLKNVITRSVGYQEKEDVDTLQIDLEHDDLILICSDGLHGLVNDNEISKITYREKVDAVPKLIDLALERGGNDNVSVIILKMTN